MSNAQEKKIENVSIAKFARYGAIGFGIGGVIGMALIKIAGDNPLLGLVGLAAMGALGGAALGLVLRRGWRKVATLALLGAIGFLAGAIIGFSGAETFEDLVPIVFHTGTTFTTVYLGGPLFFSTVWGTLGGAALGLALWDLKKAIVLALAGALGFGISMPIILFNLLGLVLIGIIGGAFLGAALGYLEKRGSANQSN